MRKLILLLFIPYVFYGQKSTVTIKNTTPGSLYYGESSQYSIEIKKSLSERMKEIYDQYSVNRNKSNSFNNNVTIINRNYTYVPPSPEEIARRKKIEKENYKRLRTKLDNRLKDMLNKVENFHQLYLSSLGDDEKAIWYAFKKITWARAYNADSKFFNESKNTIDIYDGINFEHIYLFEKFSSGLFKKHEKDAEKAIKKFKKDLAN